MNRPKIHDTRRFYYQDEPIAVRTRSDSRRTVELPLHIVAKLGYHVRTEGDQLFIEPRGCTHTNESYVGEFMMDVYECDDCGEKRFQ